MASMVAAEPERPPPALTIDLLEEIFLRVASPADLARASAACVSFRRLIADHSLLRRYRSIHPPQLLGFVSSSGFHPVEVPHPSAAVARATHFSFDHLPSPTTEIWDRCVPCCMPCDVHKGRVLIQCLNEESLVYRDLVVCDPLSGRHLLLPPITGDLIASVKIQDQNLFNFGASFIPSGGIEEEEDTSFRVISWIQSETRFGVFVFSSVSGSWSVSMSTNGNDLGLNRVCFLGSGQCVYDCFYWKLSSKSTMIKLDLNTMEFCTVDLPPGHDERDIIIVESGESKVAMFSRTYKGTSVDYYTFSQNGSDKSHEWHMMRTIPFPAHYTSICYIRGQAQGYILIECIEDEESSTYSTALSLEIKSFNIERVSRRSHPGPAYAYFGFPPSMSPRRI